MCRVESRCYFHVENISMCMPPPNNNNNDNLNKGNNLVQWLLWL